MPAYAPSVPGVTEPAAYERQLPEILRALRTKDEDGEPIPADKRAKELHKAAKGWFEAHQWYYREAKECLAMECGAQWGYWNKSTARWEPTPESRERDQVRITANLIKPGVDQATAILTSEPPVFRCAAATSEGSDQGAAEAGNDLADHIWRFHHLDDDYRGTARAAFSLGTAFLLVEWDRSKGPLFADPMQPVLGEDGSVSPTYRMLGDLRFTRLKRDQVAFDPAAAHPQDGIGLFVRRRMSRARLAELFPDRKDKLPGSGTDTTEDAGGESAVERFSPATNGSSLFPEERADRVDVFTFYRRASSDLPRGAVYVFTEDAMFHEGENDVYPTDEERARGELWPRINWPVLAFLGDQREDSPWGRGRTVDAIPINKFVNGALSKAVQHAAILANAKPYLPKGIDFEWTDEPGQVIRYGRTFQPGMFGYVLPPSMPPEYMQLVQAGRELIENGMGINAASNGATPTSDASGRLVQQLQQRDTTRLAPIKQAHDAQWAEVINFALRLYRRHAGEQRAILVIGQNKATQLKLFSGASLAAGTDVIVCNNQSIPRDPAQKTVFLTNFFQTWSQIQDERGQQLLCELYGLSDFRNFLERLDPQGVRARRLKQQILAGFPLPTFPAPQAPVMPGMPAPPAPPAGAMPWDHALTFKAELESLLTSEEYEQKVGAQKRSPDPLTGLPAGVSPLEQQAVALWQWYSDQAAAAMAPPMPAGGAVLPGPGSPPSSPGLAMPGRPSPGAPATGQPAQRAA